MRHQLTDAKVRSLTRKGMHADGGNLYLRIQTEPTTAEAKPYEFKSWVFRYMRGGHARLLTIGPAEDVSLKDARDVASGYRADLRRGIDPMHEKRRVDLRTITFEQAAKEWIKSKRPEWSNPKHVSQIENTLKDYAYPILGKLAVDEIDTELVLRVLNPIWREKTETATRVRQRIEAVLSWATVNGYRTGDNPARLRGHLEYSLPKSQKVKKVKHHEALPWKDLGAFMEKLRATDSLGARALEFTILTATRTGEVIAAEWVEFDLETAVWTVPAERMKDRKPHTIPLNDRAVTILRGLEGNHERWVFPGRGGKSHMSNMAMLKLARSMRPGLTVHGFRSTFKDWAQETTTHPRDVVEKSLAHVTKDKTEAAYARGDLLAKRRKLMNDWQAFAEKKPAKPASIGDARKAKDKP